MGGCVARCVAGARPAILTRSPEIATNRLGHFHLDSLRHCHTGRPDRHHEDHDLWRISGGRRRDDDRDCLQGRVHPDGAGTFVLDFGQSFPLTCSSPEPATSARTREPADTAGWCRPFIRRPRRTRRPERRFRPRPRRRRPARNPTRKEARRRHRPYAPQETPRKRNTPD